MSRNDVIREQLAKSGIISLRGKDGAHQRFLIDYQQFTKQMKYGVEWLVYKTTDTWLYEEEQGCSVYHLYSIEESTGIPILVSLSDNSAHLLVEKIVVPIIGKTKSDLEQSRDTN